MAKGSIVSSLPLSDEVDFTATITIMQTILIFLIGVNDRALQLGGT